MNRKTARHLREETGCPVVRAVRVQKSRQSFSGAGLSLRCPAVGCMAQRQLRGAGASPSTGQADRGKDCRPFFWQGADAGECGVGSWTVAALREAFAAWMASSGWESDGRKARTRSIVLSPPFGSGIGRNS